MAAVPVTLLTAAAAAVLNVWLGSRIGQLRRAHKISVGHGDNETLERRMRAQSNFAENAPLFLILLGALELSGAARVALAVAAVIFIAARIAHAFGMEGGVLQRWRQIGIMGSFLATVALAVWAIVSAAGGLLGR